MKRHYPHWLERAATDALQSFCDEADPMTAAHGALSAEIRPAIERAAASWQAQREAGAHWAAKTWNVGPLSIMESASGDIYDTQIAEDEDVHVAVGLPAVAAHIEGILRTVHGAPPEFCTAPALERRLKNLRVRISRNDGEACFRHEYETADGRRYLLTCDICRA